MAELQCKYLGVALEPVHVGGHDRRGAQVRDSLGMPYVPATSLRGCIRSIDYSRASIVGCDGKGFSCPQPHRCSSCGLFGFASGAGPSSSSLARFSDMKLLLSPVPTRRGPIWIGSNERMSRVVKDVSFSESRTLLGVDINQQVLKDLGFQEFTAGGLGSCPPSVQHLAAPGGVHADIFRRVVLTADQLFSQPDGVLHTEQRRSLGLDRETGAPRQGSFYSVEAILPGSVLFFDVNIADPSERGFQGFLVGQLDAPGEIDSSQTSVRDRIDYAISSLQTHGIGGRRAQGYGKVDCWSVSEEMSGEPSIPIPKQHVGLIFISYSWPDQDKAHRLAIDLRTRGFNVWLDSEQILVGERIHTEVNRALEEAQFVIALLSKSALESKWVEAELGATHAREMETGRVILLPVELEPLALEGAIPALMKDRLCAKMYASYHRGVEDLARSIVRYSGANQIGP